MKSINKFFFSCEKSLLKGCSIFLLLFLLTRLPYLLFYQINVLSFDSASYISAAFSVMNAVTPLFDIRTPGYPLFLTAVWNFSESIFSVSVMQSVFSLLTGLFVIFAFDKVYKKYSVIFALMLTLYMTSSFFLIYETALLTEGIFTDVLLICVTLMVLSLKTEKNIYIALFSASVALLILVRPAGLFFIGILILILSYYVFKKSGIKKYVSLILPFAVIISGLCTYNLFTLNKFTITPFGEANMAGVTILFMETSDEYPEFVNSAIRQTLDSISGKDKSYIRENYGVSKLYRLFKDNFFRQMNFADNLMNDDPAKKYMDIQPYMRMVSLDAIKKNPEIYMKFFGCNFYFFFKNISTELSLFDQLKYNYIKNAVEGKFAAELDKKKWLQISSDKTVNDQVKGFLDSEIALQKNLQNVSTDENGIVTFTDTFLKSVFETYETLNNFILRNILWYIPFFAMLILSVYLLMKSRLNDIDALISVLLFMIFLLKALMVSLVESSLERYSYTVEIAVYFSFPFLLILIQNLKQMKLKNKKI